MFRAATILPALVAFAITVVAAAQARRPEDLRPGQVVVLAELFTSEGCESCPPADRLLETMLKQQPIEGVYVVPLSEHVTYWDHQGWKDPFSAEQFTTRQKQYGFGFNIDSIYTPQLVIDGATQLIGSDERELKRVLSKPGAVKAHLEVDVTNAGNAIDVAISGAGLRAAEYTSRKDGGDVVLMAVQPAELMIAITEDDLVVDVRRGENAGRTMRHVGVVRVLQSIGDPQAIKPPRGAVDSMAPPARTVRVDLKPEWQRAKLRVVAFVQSKNSRKVLAIGWRSVQ